MNRTVGNALVALITVSAVAVFAIYGTFALTDATARYPHTNSLEVAGQFEAARALSIVLMLAVTAVLRKWKALGTLLLTVGLIEMSDTLIGLGQGQIGMWISPLLSGIAYLISGAYLVMRSERSKTEGI